jgi:hypothetical protein
MLSKAGRIDILYNNQDIMKIVSEFGQYGKISRVDYYNQLLRLFFDDCRDANDAMYHLANRYNIQNVGEFTL